MVSKNKCYRLFLSKTRLTWVALVYHHYHHHYHQFQVKIHTFVGWNECGCQSKCVIIRAPLHWGFVRYFRAYVWAFFLPSHDFPSVKCYRFPQQSKNSFFVFWQRSEIDFHKCATGNMYPAFTLAKIRFLIAPLKLSRVGWGEELDVLPGANILSLNPRLILFFVLVFL